VPEPLVAFLDCVVNVGDKKLLLEDTVGEFVVSSGPQRITESEVNGRKFIHISGRLSLCDTLNGNNRIYPRKVWERQFQPDSKLMKLIERNRSVGLLEHPKDGQVTLNSPISHLLVSAKLNEDGTVQGELRLINTPEGQKLRALIEAGYNPLVSSRGYGSLEKDTEGHDVVQEDYVCEGWDAVFHPSFTQCELEAAGAVESTGQLRSGRRLGESTPGVNMWCVYQALSERDYGRTWMALSESERDAVAQKANLLPQDEKVRLESEFNAKRVAKITMAENRENRVIKENQGISGQATPPKPAPTGAAPQVPSTNENHMDAIRQKLLTIAALNPKSMTPTQLSESRNQLRGLHNDVAKWQAEDQTRSYEAGQIHKSIEEVESKFDEAITGPRAESARLLTERQKTLSVLSATVDAAKTIKKHLTEAISKNGKLASVNAKLLEAVRAWKQEAEHFQALAALYEDKYNLSCDTLDVMSDRWKSNTTELGRRVVELEFAEAVKNPEVKKKLDEAKHPDDVADVRESLLPKNGTGQVVENQGQPQGKPQGQPAQAAPQGQPQPLNEAQRSTSNATAQSQGGLKQPTVVQHTRHPGTLKESIAIARRLSGRPVEAAAAA